MRYQARQEKVIKESHPHVIVPKRLQETCRTPPNDSPAKTPEDIHSYLYLLYKIYRLITAFLERWIDE